MASSKTGKTAVPEAKEAMNKFKMEVADEIGISQAQVSRLEKTAIEHIKRLYKYNF